jgi:hypothetical protein
VTSTTLSGLETGAYTLEIRGRHLGEVGPPTLYDVFIFNPGEVQGTKQPTGLELLLSGVRGGNTREFTGRSISFIWNAINYDGSLTEQPLAFPGLDEVPPDNFLTGWLVRLFDADTQEMFREHRQDLAVHSYTYAYDDHAEDGLRRSVRLQLYTIDRTGNLSQPAVIVVSNTAPAAPTGILVESTPGVVFVSADRPDDPDLDVLLVWGSDTPGFTPAPSNLLATGGQGSNDVPLFWDAGTTVYIRLAWCDAFSRDVDDLNLSAEQTEAVPSAEVEDDSIDEAKLDPNVRKGLSAAYSNLFDQASDIDDIEQGSAGVAAADLDSFSGSLAVKFSYTGAAPSDTANTTPYLVLPPRSALAISGQRVRVKVWAKKPASGGSTNFRVALDSGAGSSGWQTFTSPVGGYAPREFLFLVPTITDPTAVKLRFHGDSASGGLAILIDNVSVIPLLEKIDATNRDTHLDDNVVTTNKIVSASVSGLYEASDSAFTLFTGSDAGTWKEIIELPGVEIVGQNPGESAVGIFGIFEATADHLADFLTVGTVLVPFLGPNSPQMEWRLVRDKGAGSEEVIYTSSPFTISVAGSGVGATASPYDLAAAGTHTYTIEARWSVPTTYSSGTAQFSGTVDMVGSGVDWVEWLHPAMQIRIPSIDATWFSIGSITNQTKIQITGGHSHGTTGFAAYETRFDSSELTHELIMSVQQARIQILEYRR